MVAEARGGLIVAMDNKGIARGTAGYKTHAEFQGIGFVEVDPADQVGAGFFDTDITITGVVVGDIVVMIPPFGLEDELIMLGAAVQAADTVRIKMEAKGAINGAALDWAYQWFDVN